MVCADRHPGIRHGAHDGGTCVRQCLAGLGEHQVPALLARQRHLDAALQRRQLLGYGGGRDQEGFGNRLDAAEGAEFPKHFQLMDFHPPILLLRNP